MLATASQYPILVLQNALEWMEAIKGIRYQPLTLDDICSWQGMITGEQIKSGHELPRDAIGRIRSESLPVDVYVGRYMPPSFSEVPELLDRWLESLNRTLASKPPGIADADVVDCLGSHFQWFEAIHPSVDYVTTRE